MSVSNIVYFESLHDPAINSTLQSWSDSNLEAGAFVLVAEADKEGIPGLQKTFCDENYPMLGAMFPEIILDGRFIKNGVLMMLFSRMPKYHIISGLSRKSGSINNAFKGLQKDIDAGNGSEKSTLFLIFDSMIPNIASIFDELYFILGDGINYMGVNAGSETFQAMPCIFDNDSFVQDAALGIIFPDHEGAVLEHGYHTPEHIISATSTKGNRIVSIDWQPAFKVFAQIAKKQYGADINRDNFYEIGVHFPFGLLLASGELLIRIPVAIEEDGSIICVGEIPENSVLVLLNSKDCDIEFTAHGLTKRLSDNKALDNLIFYCAGRRLHHGKNADKELEKLKDSLEPAFTAGALSLGEIGTTKSNGYPMFHNAAIVCSKWGNK